MSASVGMTLKQAGSLTCRNDGRISSDVRKCQNAFKQGRYHWWKVHDFSVRIFAVFQRDLQYPGKSVNYQAGSIS